MKQNNNIESLPLDLDLNLLSHLKMFGGSDSHLSRSFQLFGQKFWEVAGTYKCYFVTLLLQVEWWGHLEMVRHSNPICCN